MLVQNKIFANEKLMLAHLLSFFFVAIFAVITSTIYLTGVLEENPENMTNRQKNILLAEIICAYFQSISQLGVIGTMMIMFIKHSHTISEAKQKKIEHSFLLVFSN